MRYVVSDIQFPLWIVPVGFLVIFGLAIGLAYPFSRRLSSVTTIEVGVLERHVVRLSWNQWSGRVRIFLEDTEVQRSLEFFSRSTLRTYAISVGTEERHEVTFEKRRPRAFAGLRKQSITASVDGVRVPSQRSSGSLPSSAPSQRG